MPKELALKEKQNLNKLMPPEDLFENLYREVADDYINQNMELQKHIKFGKRLDIMDDILFFEEELYDQINFVKDDINFLNAENERRSSEKKLQKPQAKFKSNTMVGIKPG